MDISIPQNFVQGTTSLDMSSSQPVVNVLIPEDVPPLVQEYWWSHLEHHHIPKSPGIYAIINLQNKHFYVGSAVKLIRRKWSHFKDLKAGNHKNGHLQHAYNLYGAHEFRFVIIEHVEHVEDLLAREQYYLDSLNPEYNIARTAGNTLGIKLTDEQKSKLVAAHTGKKLSPEHRAKISGSQRGKKKTPEQVEKVRSALRGRTLAPEQRAQISATLTGKKQSPERIEKRIAPIRGTKWSEERRAKVLAAWETKREAGMANVGNPLPPETRAKISTALKGKKKSPEAIEKSAAARRGRSLSDEAKEKIRLSKVGKKLSPEVVEKRASKLRGKPRPPEVIEKMKATLAAKRAAKLAEQQASQPPLF